MGKYVRLVARGFLCYKTPPLPYKNTGNPNGRPRKERLDLRLGISVSPKVRNWAVLELAAEDLGFKTLGHLLDDAANKIGTDLSLSDGKIQERARAILKRHGIK